MITGGYKTLSDYRELEVHNVDWRSEGGTGALIFLLNRVNASLFFPIFPPHNTNHHFAGHLPYNII